MRIAPLLVAFLCACQEIRPSIVESGPESERPCEAVGGPPTVNAQECQREAEITGRLIDIPGVQFIPSR